VTVCSPFPPLYGVSLALFREVPFFCSSRPHNLLVADQSWQLHDLPPHFLQLSTGKNVLTTLFWVAPLPQTEETLIFAAAGFPKTPTCLLQTFFALLFKDLHLNFFLPLVRWECNSFRSIPEPFFLTRRSAACFVSPPFQTANGFPPHPPHTRSRFPYPFPF